MQKGKHLRVLLVWTLTIVLSFLFWTHLYKDDKIDDPDRKNHLKLTKLKELDLTSRTAKVRKMCEEMAPSGKVSVRSIMTNRTHKLAYCFIPKCGCTFWKRVFRFLNKDYKGKNITSPFQISRMESHQDWSHPDPFVPFKRYREMSMSFTSFMFVRELYARLWSAYVDKFYLPGLWSNLKRDIISRRPKSEASKCVSDVTFNEFANLVLTTSEPHWNPMHTMCDPCTYKPSIIGRVESFSSDSRIILDRGNLSWILDGYDHVNHMVEEVTMLIQFNLKDLPARKPYVRKCISKMGLFQRLWKTFQINGYIPKDISVPSVDQTTTVAEFTGIVLDQLRQGPNTPEVWRKQREEFMIAAYKNVSTVILNNLRKKYQKDFLLFNYNPAPVEIFGERDRFA